MNSVVNVLFMIKTLYNEKSDFNTSASGVFSDFM